ncbi:MAG: M42 family metallopeptidase [Alphaproteobacteria bacterium]|jgi:putative aminopeptidase FrvX
MRITGIATALALGLTAPAAAQDRTLNLLRDLTEAAGPPGFEEPVRKIMVEQMRPLADTITYDGLGSVIATQGKSGPRIMIAAHMDELGGMVRRTTPDGYITMQMLGGWLDQALIGQRWIIIGSKGPVRAVTGVRDIHVVAPDERTKVFPRDSVFLDVGAANAAEVAAMGVSPGDPVVPDAPFVVLNGTQNYMGKAWDDRIGCAVMIEAMRRLKGSNHPNQLFFVATVQEEIGLRGAEASSALVRPDIGFAIEAGVVGDVPGARPEESQVSLGAGPGMFLYDSSALPNRKLVALVKDTARAKNIPLQLDLVQGYGDDSAEIQRSNGGVPTVNLVVPTRYTHVHTGIINRRDFEQMVDLMVALLQRLDANAVKELRNFAP